VPVSRPTFVLAQLRRASWASPAKCRASPGCYQLDLTWAGGPGRERGTSKKTPAPRDPRAALAGGFGGVGGWEFTSKHTESHRDSPGADAHITKASVVTAPGGPASGVTPGVLTTDDRAAHAGRVIVSSVPKEPAAKHLLPLR
jgi:hypothetical protein